jgi:hypothetical protein
MPHRDRHPTALSLVDRIANGGRILGQINRAFESIQLIHSFPIATFFAKKRITRFGDQGYPHTHMNKSTFTTTFLL